MTLCCKLLPLCVQVLCPHDDLTDTLFTVLSIVHKIEFASDDDLHIEPFIIVVLSKTVRI